MKPKSFVFLIAVACMLPCWSNAREVIQYALAPGLPILDEGSLVRAAGLPVAKRYALDDGHGINFRKSPAPDLKLEFRASRVNVVWFEFDDLPAGKNAINADNRKRAQSILVKALGSGLAEMVVGVSASGKGATIKAGGTEVRVMASGGSMGMHMITIDRQR